VTKKNLWTLLILALLAMTAAACSVLSEPPAPSGELETAPLEVESAAEAVPAEEELAKDAPKAEVPVEEAAAEEAPIAAGAGLLIYQIDPAASQVRFELNELLRGSPKTVVGITDQVSGEIAADLNDLSSVQVGEIRINARTLATDNDFRNRALNNKILNTGDYEFITFVPSAVNGLPENAALGSTIEFTIDGDLTIRDSSMPVTFNVTASPVSDTQLVGSAAATVTRADFNLVIPTVPDVADVEEEVELYIDFVANVP
jgi:polyisoprenoid-binding protein YceI